MSAVTEDEIKAMGIKELKEFIRNRGAKCEGCSEKQHFIDEALKHRLDASNSDSAEEDIEEEEKPEPKKVDAEDPTDDSNDPAKVLLQYLKMSNPSLTEEDVLKMLKAGTEGQPINMGEAKRDEL